jgi:hypothetical protein
VPALFLSPSWAMADQNSIHILLCNLITDLTAKNNLCTLLADLFCLTRAIVSCCTSVNMHVRSICTHHILCPPKPLVHAWHTHTFTFTHTFTYTHKHTHTHTQTHIHTPVHAWLLLAVGPPQLPLPSGVSRSEKPCVLHSVGQCGDSEAVFDAVWGWCECGAMQG